MPWEVHKKCYEGSGEVEVHCSWGIGEVVFWARLFGVAYICFWIMWFPKKKKKKQHESWSRGCCGRRGMWIWDQTRWLCLLCHKFISISYAAVDQPPLLLASRTWQAPMLSVQTPFSCLWRCLCVFTFAPAPQWFGEVLSTEPGPKGGHINWSTHFSTSKNFTMLSTHLHYIHAPEACTHTSAHRVLYTVAWARF